MSDETNATPTIDLEKIKAAAQQAVAGMSTEQLLAEAAKIRTRQKLQQKKQQAKGGNKAYMKAKLEKEKLIREAVEKLGKTEEINAAADAEAEQKFQEHLSSLNTGDEGEEAVS